MKTNELTEQIIGAAIEVHCHKGPGLLESTYELCLQHELTLRGIQSERQLMLPIEYKGLIVPEAYRLDLLVENKVIVELKTVSALQDIPQPSSSPTSKPPTNKLASSSTFTPPSSKTESAASSTTIKKPSSSLYSPLKNSKNSAFLCDLRASAVKSIQPIFISL